MRIVIATFNASKAREIGQILSARFPNIQWLSLREFPYAKEPEETGADYKENALIKAISAAQETGEMCVADDAGLEIDALGGAPGLYSKRFGGEDLPFSEKMALILDKLAGRRPEQRKARFRCWVAIAWLNEAEEIESHTFEGVCDGQIVEAMRGSGGFGYDPIFRPDGLDCTMAELTSEQKHAISHRGKVLQMFGDFLDQHLGTLIPDGDAGMARPGL